MRISDWSSDVCSSDLIALCDAGWTIASPAETIRRTKFSKDMAALSAFCAAHAVKGLVMGLPLNLDGSDSPRTQSVRAFARNLQPLGLPILLWDERWSTQAVTRTDRKSTRLNSSH